MRNQHRRVQAKAIAIAHDARIAVILAMTGLTALLSLALLRI